jgi:MFS family permease
MYVGSLNYLLENNAEKATATGMLNSAVSLAGIIGPLIGGFTAEFYGYRTVLINASILAFISFIAFITLSKNSFFKTGQNR